MSQKDDDELRKQISELRKEGMSVQDIRKELGIGMNKLNRIMKSIPRDTGKEIQPPPPTDQHIIDQAAQWGAEKVASTLSTQIHDDYIGSMKAAQILKSAEMRYRRPLEDMGWEWHTWLEQAIEYAFKKTEERERLKAFIATLQMREVE